jgi:hypothetical protein
MVEIDPTGNAPRSDPPEPKTRSKRVECNFCNCILDSDGEIISMGKRAKEFRAMAENDETRISRIAALESEVADLKKQLAEKKPEVDPDTPKGRKSVLDALIPRGART